MLHNLTVVSDPCHQVNIRLPCNTEDCRVAVFVLIASFFLHAISESHNGYNLSLVPFGFHSFTTGWVCAVVSPQYSGPPVLFPFALKSSDLTGRSIRCGFWRHQIEEIMQEDAPLISVALSLVQGRRKRNGKSGPERE